MNDNMYSTNYGSGATIINKSNYFRTEQPVAMVTVIATKLDEGYYGNQPSTHQLIPGS